VTSLRQKTTQCRPASRLLDEIFFISLSLFQRLHTADQKERGREKRAKGVPTRKKQAIPSPRSDSRPSVGRSVDIGHTQLYQSECLQAPPLKRVPRTGLAGSVGICASILCRQSVCGSRIVRITCLVSGGPPVQVVKRSGRGKIDA
jgi:hypothetical protein